MDKYKYLTGKGISPSNQQQIIEQARFTYSPLGKAFEKQIQTIKDQGEKQIDVLKDLKPKEQTKSIEGIFPEGYETVEIKNKINKIKEHKKKLIEIKWFLIQAKNYLILKRWKQHDL